MIFKNNKHAARYINYLKKDNTDKYDCYRKAFFYLIALSDTLAAHIDEFYDFENGQIKEISIEDPLNNQPWQSGGTSRLYMFALNLYNDIYKCDVSNIFYGWENDIIYLFEAVKIRYTQNYCLTDVSIAEPEMAADDKNLLDDILTDLM